MQSAFNATVYVQIKFCVVLIFYKIDLDLVNNFSQNKIEEYKVCMYITKIIYKPGILNNCF